MKTYSLKTSDGAVEIQLRKHHLSKQMRLSVRRGRVLVTLPKRYPYKAAEQFARSKQDWIIQQLESSQPLTKPTKTQRRQAAAVAKELVKYWSQKMEVDYTRVSIRNQSTRWGSCSTSGTLSFNWRIILLPAELQTYLAIHELAHVRHPNHSKKFWQLVKRFNDNYTTHRQQLRQIDLASLER
jgi:predicted metal-dependent hydrolase